MNTAANSINSFNQIITKVFGPIAALYLKAFNYNKYLAGTGFAAFITLGLFFLMVALINLGDNSIPTDNSRKLGDVIMPERDIDTLFDNVYLKTNNYLMLGHHHQHKIIIQHYFCWHMYCKLI